MKKPNPEKGVPELLMHDKELMRLASLVGTDAKTPELKLAMYIHDLFKKEWERVWSEGFGKGYSHGIEDCSTAIKEPETITT